MYRSAHASGLYEGHSKPPSFNLKKLNHLCLHIPTTPPKDAGYSLDYTECDKGDEDTAHLLLAVKEAARVMLGSLLAKLVGESTLPVLWELEWRKNTLG